MKRVVVTGGAGFIGTHLVRRLAAEGRRVLVVDDFSHGRRERLLDLERRIEIRVGDLRDYAFTVASFKDSDCIYHLAARVGNVEFLHSSETAELAALQTNLVIDANVFRACKAVGVKTLIYASSVSVYPIDHQRKHDAVFEENELEPISPEGGYGWAKLMGEVQLQWMKDARSGVARIFSAYGEGEEPGEFAHAIPALVGKAVAYPSEEFRVWGDGSQSRDYLHVDDVVEAFLRLEQAAAWPPLVVNVGAGRSVTVRSLVEKIVRISGKSIIPVFDPNRLVGPVSRTASIDRARRLLMWEPRVQLDEGLLRTYRWVEARLKQLDAAL